MRRVGEGEKKCNRKDGTLPMYILLFFSLFPLRVGLHAQNCRLWFYSCQVEAAGGGGEEGGVEGGSDPPTGTAAAAAAAAAVAIFFLSPF